MPHTTAENGQRDHGMEPIAVVGMSCTLAGGVDRPSKLWETLINKEIRQSARIPESRFNIDAYYHDKAFGQPAAIGSKGGFFLDMDLNTFDAAFFGYEADEANHMDPQHFRTLESVYECLESAGRTIEDVKGTNTAVYIGNFSLDRVIQSARNSYDDRHLHEVIGIDPGLLSSRISYCFDMNGPVYTTNTGCTSSLFALHTAAMALRGGECDAALVGGVNLLQGPEAYSSYSKFGIMSADSMCHTFDARCNGYCRAEGAGTLYVRRLSDAVRDGDPIRGVIRSIAVNSNGYVPGMPLFVPNQQGLEKAMQLAYAQANLNPYDTAYVETHGIGMILGEIAEAHAVGKFFNHPKKREGPMLMGSMKPNFGHQEAGSGIFVIMKAAMMTEAGVIPAHADFKIPHPAIDFEVLNIKPQTENLPWPESYSCRRVGLSSYGWSGTNAHIVVEDIENLYPGYQAIGKPRGTPSYDHSTSRPLLITFSAFNRSSLEHNIENHRIVADRYFAADLAYTLNERRSKFQQRAFTIVSGDSSEPLFKQSAMSFGSVTEKPAVLLFNFGTLNESLKSAAADCLQVYPSFAETVAQLEAALKEAGSPIDLQGLLSENVISTDEARGEIAAAAIHIAFIDLFTEWGVKFGPAEHHTGNDTVINYAAKHIKFEQAIQAITGKADDQNLTGSKASNGSQGIKTGVTAQLGQESDSSPLSGDTLRVTSLRDVLELAGRYYVQGGLVHFAKVNVVKDVDWTASLLVDLPPYHWDHSKSYSAESFANKEQRTNKHPYHALLGRRVFGLSPQSMIWKNKLSFADLPDSIPWVPNPKPDVTIALPEFASMIVEAVRQISGDSGSSVFSVENLVLKQSLQYGADVDLVEMQTSFSKLPGASDSYVVSFSSVVEGRWTQHCEGTITFGPIHQEAEHTVQESKGDAHKLELHVETHDDKTTLTYPELVRACLGLAKPAEAGGIEKPASQIRALTLYQVDQTPSLDWLLSRQSTTSPGIVHVDNGSGKRILTLEVGH